MMKMNTMKTLRNAIALASLVSCAVSAQDDPMAAVGAEWYMLDNYCLKCHNFNDFAGGLALEGMNPESLHTDPAIWEEVLLKLRAGMMPPVGQKGPSREERADFIAALENSLDAVATQNPNPGTVVLHRLNRTEYATAV